MRRTGLIGVSFENKPKEQITFLGKGGGIQGALG